MPRLYAVQQCDRLQGWRDVSYHRSWLEAERASEGVASNSSGLVTRVTRKPHGFRPPSVPVTRIFALGHESPVDIIQGHAEPVLATEGDDVEAERLRRKYQKQRSREAGAKARIPTWYDRLLRD